MGKGARLQLIGALLLALRLCQTHASRAAQPAPLSKDALLSVESTPSRTVMAWMGWEGRTDAQLEEIVVDMRRSRDNMVETPAQFEYLLALYGQA